MRTGKHRWRELIILLATLSAALVWGVDQIRSVNDKSKIARLTSHKKTVCVGRLLVDVPAQASVSLSRQQIDGFTVDTGEESEVDFRDRVAAREGDIATKAAKAGPHDPGGMIEARDLEVPGMIGRVFVFGRDHTYGIENGRRVESEWVSIEAHAHRAGFSITLAMNFADEVDASAAEALLSRLQLRGEHEIPVAPGFCIDRAFFAEPLPKHSTEHVVMFLDLPDHPDMAVVLASLNGQGSGRGLLSRSAGKSFVERLLVKELRAQGRDINGIPGEEALERIREFNLANTYVFNWEARGVAGDLLKPFLSLELQAGMSQRAGGKPVDASLHQDAVLAFWDSIASSIRLHSKESQHSVDALGPPRLDAAVAIDQGTP